jgi:hypothetical protein
MYYSYANEEDKGENVIDDDMKVNPDDTRRDEG